MTALAVRARASSDSAPRDARRFYDPALGAWVVKVLPGDYHVSDRDDEVIVTVLGSCVAACIRDPERGVGGLNHFLLPQSERGRWGDEQDSIRYGNFAMEKLINELLKAGCDRARFEVKVFGGGSVIESQAAIGDQNAAFVLRYLSDEGLVCAAQDLGGALARRITYSPRTGKVVRRFIGGAERDASARDERAYLQQMAGDRLAGHVEIFGQWRPK